MEEQIRKDIREKRIEKVRKPILSTPTRKRERKEEGAWQPTPGQEEIVEASPSTPRSMRQTPMGTSILGGEEEVYAGRG